MRKLICLVGMLVALPSRATIVENKTALPLSARTFHVTPIQMASGATTIPLRFVAPYSGRLVDVVIQQVVAGNGTTWSISLRNAAGTALFSVVPVMTAASGTYQTTDAKGDIALPSGWTRPVIKTDGTEIVAKGTYLDLLSTETGTYSTHATFVITFIFEPIP